jgi:hypothetical protein
MKDARIELDALKRERTVLEKIREILLKEQIEQEKVKIEEYLQLTNLFSPGN